MQGLAIVLYVVALLSFIVYLYNKYVLRKYLFSPFNISLFVYAFASFIIAPFQFADAAWNTLQQTSSMPFHPYLYKCMVINYLGFIIYLLALSRFEFKNGNNTKFDKLVDNCSRLISPQIIKLSLYTAAGIIIYIMFRYAGGLLLFIEERTYFHNTILSPIYLAIIFVLSTSVTFIAYEFVFYKKGITAVLIGLFCILTTANRGSFLLVLCTIIILGIYNKTRKERINVWRIVAVATISILLLTILENIRRGQQGFSGIHNIFQSILFGNTFSDYRDGAYILYGFENNYGNTFLLGKTYIAGIISFIPSRISEYRSMYGYGRFVTSTLFGISEHYGFRGGNSMELYFNFGFAAVIIGEFIKGYLSASLERLFSKYIIHKEYLKTGFTFLIPITFIALLNSFLISTSNVYNLYVLIIYCLVLIVLSAILNTVGKANKHVE